MDSNHRPLAFQANTLPTELPTHKLKSGGELGTRTLNLRLAKTLLYL